MARFTVVYFPDRGMQITCRYQPKGAEPRVITDYARTPEGVPSIMARQVAWLSAVRPKATQYEQAYMNLQEVDDGH